MRGSSRGAMLLAGGLFLCWHAALTFLLPMSAASGIRFWGGNAFRYLPVPAAILGYALAAGGIAAVAFGRRIPGSWPASRAFRRIPPKTDRTAGPGTGGSAVGPATASPRFAETSRLLGPLCVLGTVAVFFVLHSRYGLLGDNMLRVREAEQGAIPANDFGIMTVYAVLARIGRNLSVATSRQVFAGVSLFGGFLYASVAWTVARRLAGGGAGQPAGRVLLLYAGLVTAGAVELFCGYLEVYPLVLAWLLLTVSGAMQAAEGDGPVFLPLLLLALGIVLHREAVFWIPAVLAPLWIRRRTGSARHAGYDGVAGLEGGAGLAGVPGLVSGAGLAGREARRVTGLLLGLGAVAGLVFAGRMSVLLPVFSAGEGGYTLFSAAHLSDYGNAQFLGSAAAFLLAPVALAVWMRSECIRPSSQVALLAWLLPAAGLFFFRPLLGGADWDVLSLAAPFGFVFAAGQFRGPAGGRPEVEAVGRAATDSSGGPDGRPGGTRAPAAAGPSISPAAWRWIALAVILSAFNTVPWLIVQAGDASLDRARELIESDRADYFRAHPAPLHLAFVFAGNGLEELQRAELSRGEEQFPEDPRFPYNLSVLARARGDWKEAEEAALAAFQRQRDYLPPLDVLYDAYKLRGAREDQGLVGRAILEAYGNRRELAERYFSTDRIEQIRREVEVLPK